MQVRQASPRVVCSKRNISSICKDKSILEQEHPSELGCDWVSGFVVVWLLFLEGTGFFEDNEGSSLGHHIFSFWSPLNMFFMTVKKIIESTVALITEAVEIDLIQDGVR